MYQNDLILKQTSYTANSKKTKSVPKTEQQKPHTKNVKYVIGCKMPEDSKTANKNIDTLPRNERQNKLIL